MSTRGWIGARRAALEVGTAFGASAALLWLAVVGIGHVVPGDATVAALLVFAAAAGAGYSSRRGGLVQASLTAGTIASLSIVVSVRALMSLVPDSWVSPIVTVALTPADNVAQSRVETFDPYVGLLLLGALFGLALLVDVLPRLRRPAQTSPIQPV
ncbi:mannose/fructose/N-acetylgalactosamine-specific phosphotransferase system component IIC [Phycicoccus badiiscoriae]|uniref:Mannose/fructose/N-acetylgalactosamine-specific phosphotransferase system component IIC n=1 Tax=Pedococcus badiiscoriae TaxID=642776 RepID=A0A852WSJ8_9MICO|nr:hypothetical protein [Pedococcus badiiscoriae]NYG08266.1 mannose/fructose/N-acetylgalactosamine-specific phosphotransferase system component IIC [Pedococcus badiiscoriae]